VKGWSSVVAVGLLAAGCREPAESSPTSAITVSTSSAAPASDRPPPAGDASVVIEEVRVERAQSAGAMEAVAKLKPGIDACAKQAQSGGRKLEGSLTVVSDVAKTGLVIRVQHRGDPALEPVTRCLSRVFSAAKFGELRGGEEATVTVVIRLT
jgi:hypothetical protein